MDTLDILLLPDDTRVIVTIDALKSLYYQGWSAGNWDDCDAELTIKGEIV